MSEQVSYKPETSDLISTDCLENRQQFSDHDIPPRISGSPTQRVLQRDKHQCAIKELGLCENFQCDGNATRVDVHHILPKQMLRFIRNLRPEVSVPMNHPGILVSLCRHSHEQLHRIDPEEAKQYFNPDEYTRYYSAAVIEGLYQFVENEELNVDPRLDKLFLRTARERNVALWEAGIWTHLMGNRQASILNRIGE